MLRVLSSGRFAEEDPRDADQIAADAKTKAIAAKHTISNAMFEAGMQMDTLILVVVFKMRGYVVFATNGIAAKTSWMTKKAGLEHPDFAQNMAYITRMRARLRRVHKDLAKASSLFIDSAAESSTSKEEAAALLMGWDVSHVISAVESISIIYGEEAEDGPTLMISAGIQEVGLPELHLEIKPDGKVDHEVPPINSVSYSILMQFLVVADALGLLDVRPQLRMDIDNIIGIDDCCL